jgi:cytochrome oxidase Cu insertion factor (SCO1/SenC/PrrC family)
MKLFQKRDLVILPFGLLTLLVLLYLPRFQTWLDRAAFEAELQKHGLPVGTAAPELTGRDLAGTEIRLNNFKGRVVMVVFNHDG